jgi:hypothetical protein
VDPQEVENKSTNLRQNVWIQELSLLVEKGLYTGYQFGDQANKSSREKARAWLVGTHVINSTIRQKKTVREKAKG